MMKNDFLGKNFVVQYVKGDEELTSPTLSFQQAEDFLNNEEFGLYIKDISNNKIYNKETLKLIKNEAFNEKVFVIISTIILTICFFYMYGTLPV